MPAVRCDDALNTTPVPAKIQSVEEVGAKKCVQAWVFELATAARPVAATLKGSAIGILDDHVAGGHLHRTKARTRARQESSCKLFRTPQWISLADSSFGDLLVDQAFFALGINEFALKRALKPFYSSSGVVMGLSVVLDIKPRAELLWVLAIKSGGCWKERDVSLGLEFARHFACVPLCGNRFPHRRA